MFGKAIMSRNQATTWIWVEMPRACLSEEFVFSLQLCGPLVLASHIDVCLS